MRPGGDRVRDGLGFGFGLEVRDAQGGVTGEHQFAVTPAVALEGDRGGVEVSAVSLEDEVVVGPEEVDLDPALGDFHWDVEERSGYGVREDERQDFRLERALEAPLLGDRHRLAPFVDQRSKAPIPPPSLVHRRLDRRDVEVFLLRCPLEAAAQRPIANRPREVHQRPRRAGAGDAGNGPNLVAPRRPHPVKADPVDLPAPGGRRNDVYDHRAFVQQAQKRPSAPV